MTMTKSLKSEIKKYVNDINALIFTDRVTRHKFIRGFKNDIFNYAQDNHVTDIKEIAACFGEPEEVARNFLETIDLKTLRQRTNLTKLMISFVISAALIWGCSVGISALNYNIFGNHKNENHIVVSRQFQNI